MQADESRVARIAQFGVGHVHVPPAIRALGRVEGRFEFARGATEEAVAEDDTAGEARDGGAESSELHTGG